MTVLCVFQQRLYSLKSGIWTIDGGHDTIPGMIKKTGYLYIPSVAKSLYAAWCW